MSPLLRKLPGKMCLEDLVLRMYNPLFRRVGFRNLTLLRGKAKYKTDQIVSKSSFGEVSFGDTWYPDPFFCGIKLRHFCGTCISINYYTTPYHLLKSLLFMAAPYFLWYVRACFIVCANYSIIPKVWRMHIKYTPAYFYPFTALLSS